MEHTRDHSPQLLIVTVTGREEVVYLPNGDSFGAVTDRSPMVIQYQNAQHAIEEALVLGHTLARNPKAAVKGQQGDRVLFEGVPLRDYVAALHTGKLPEPRPGRAAERPTRTKREEVAVGESGPTKAE